MAKSRQGSRAGHWPHTALALWICSTAGPVVPMGKNRAGSVFRQAASVRQSVSPGDAVGKVSANTLSRLQLVDTVGANVVGRAGG